MGYDVTIKCRRGLIRVIIVDPRWGSPGQAVTKRCSREIHRDIPSLHDASWSVACPTPHVAPLHHNHTRARTRIAHGRVGTLPTVGTLPHGRLLYLGPPIISAFGVIGGRRAWWVWCMPLTSERTSLPFLHTPTHQPTNQVRDTSPIAYEKSSLSPPLPPSPTPKFNSEYQRLCRGWYSQLARPTVHHTTVLDSRSAWGSTTLQCFFGFFLGDTRRMAGKSPFLPSSLPSLPSLPPPRTRPGGKAEEHTFRMHSRLP